MQSRQNTSVVLTALRPWVAAVALGFGRIAPAGLVSDLPGVPKGTLGWINIDVSGELIAIDSQVRPVAL
ncbi:hypothetical protein GGQ88_002168 [Novosphingobium hassiacum]|uniref:Uncharacterized protein n=1 Tax=Novosphingobium hassiacum TaxID=173676 RepID=A0A7W6EWI9_9SPHN|nr:hypothetical protein [Novosphingobium hassiacum]MBB3860899.1 hypothetical protein [Novosphingobium hassiacum]